MAVCNVSLQVIPRGSEDIYINGGQSNRLYYEDRSQICCRPDGNDDGGELPELLEIVKKAQDICVEDGANRVISVVKIDYSPKGVTIDEKTAKYR
jgi:hypothetical protein